MTQTQFHSPPLVYISGAITGRSQADLELFRHATLWLNANGYMAWNPLEHDMPHADTQEEAWTRALCRDIAVITDCAGIAVLETFAQSKGALLECFVAISLRKKIVLLPDQSVGWPDMVKSYVQTAQAILWKHVPRDRFAHHTDLPEQHDLYGQVPSHRPMPHPGGK